MEGFKNGVTVSGYCGAGHPHPVVNLIHLIHQIKFPHPVT